LKPPVERAVAPTSAWTVARVILHPVVKLPYQQSLALLDAAAGRQGLILFCYRPP